LKEAESLNRRGEELFRAKRFEEALQYFGKAIELDPALSKAYHNRGEAYSKLGRADEARADFQKAEAFMSREASSTAVPKYNYREAHNIYGEVFSDGIDEIDNLWDDLFPSSSENQGLPAVLQYIDGRMEDVSSAVLFQPTRDDVTIILEDGSERVVPLKQLSCIRMADIPSQFTKPTEACQVDIIETVAGNRYQQYVLDQHDLENGLFGFSTKADPSRKYSFFPKSSIRHRYQDRFLGDILVERGLIDSANLKRALEAHKDLKSLKFGRIMAKTANILYQVVDKEINRAHQDKNKQVRIGEVLMAAGLVNEQQINEALETQKRLRKKKLGRFLIERGFLKEEDVFIALAEKFRMEYVDLRQYTISRKALTLLPRDLVLKLQVLPVTFRDSALVVATMYPEIPAIKDIIAKYSKQRNIQLVLARPTQLRKIIRQLYKKTA